jgi:hypothetical protein
VLDPSTTRQEAAGEVLLVRGEAGEHGHLGTREAEVRLGLEVDALADHDVHVEAVLGDVGSDVAAGVAPADDEDTGPRQVGDVRVAAGVQLRARERAGEVGDMRAPEVAVRHEHALERALVTPRGDDPPPGGTDRCVTGGNGRHRLHLGVERDEGGESVVAGEGLDVAAHLVAAGEVGVLRRHREALERGGVPRGDEVQRVVVAVPVAADAAGALEAHDLVPGRAQLLDGGQAGGTGTDDAVAGHARSFAGGGGPGESGTESELSSTPRMRHQP